MVKKNIKRSSVIIPGTQKSGTTTIFHILSTHSMIDEQECSEPNFFALNEETIKENMDWYINLYSKDEQKYLLDNSNLYLHHKRTPSLIKNFISDTKVIIILRNPIKRAYSSYLHMHKKVPCADRRNFKSIIKYIYGSMVSLDKHELINIEEENIMKNIEKIDENYLDEYYLKRKKKDVNFKSYFEDTLLPYKYFRRSLYSIDVNRFKRNFDEIKIIFLEELIDKTEEVMKDVLDFLDLDYEKELFELPHKNVTKIPRNKLSRDLLYINKKFIPWPLNKKIKWQMKNKSILYKPKPKLSKELYEKGRGLLKKEYDYWISKHPKLEEYWTY